MGPIALRSLLLAGLPKVSTQHAVSPTPNAAAKAAPYAKRLALGLWAWTAVIVVIGLLAWRNGGEASAVAAAGALALAPAFTGFGLLPWLCRAKWADAGLISVWIVTAAGLVAGGGGAASPLASAFIIAPALALALGRRWIPEAAAASVIAYAAGAGFALLAHEPTQLGPFPEMMAVATLCFGAVLMAYGQAPSRRAYDAGGRIAEVSHELRTPLTHILGFSEMIERQIFGPVGERYVEYAGLIRRSGNHLLGLVNDLLDLSRIDAGRFELQRERFDVRALVEDVVRLSADAAQKKAIALGMLTPDAPLLVSADERALRRVLINTIGNAVKFTPEGGKVIVAARTDDGALVLDTIDDGPGISDAEKERLGQAFERGASGARAEGTGLGLSLVRALAALHGGTLSFHDAPGGGALVRVRLPVLAAD